MVKLLLCLLSVMAIALNLLQLRQQHLELSHQNSVLHNRIEAMQSKLWGEQLQIGVATAPNAIEQTVSQNLKLAPPTPLPPGHPNWLDVHIGPTAAD